MKATKPAPPPPRADDRTSEAELPPGWAGSRIGDVLVIKYGKALKAEDRKPGGVPVYGSNGVVGQHNAAITQAPVILLGRKGSVGAVHLSRVPCWPIDTTYFIDEFHGLSAQYMAYALQALSLVSLESSTAIPGLNRDDVYDQEIAVAPLPEQRRIVAKLDALLARVRAARDRLARVPAILKRFRRSVLGAVCSGQLTEDWRARREGECVVAQCGNGSWGIPRG